MSAPPGSTPEPAPYIRARGGGEVDARRVGRIALALCVMILAVVVVAMTIGAAQQNSTQTRLQREGVPVEVTVTKCYAYGTGIGQSVTYYSCVGNYTLDGHSYTEVIGGNRALLPAGETLRAFTVRGHPALLSTATAVAKKFSPWTPFITPIILAVVTVGLAAGLLLWPRWRRRGRSRRQPVSSVTVA